MINTVIISKEGSSVQIAKPCTLQSSVTSLAASYGIFLNDLLRFRFLPLGKPYSLFSARENPNLSVCTRVLYKT